YCSPEIADDAEPFAAELKIALAGISEITFFVARSVKAEVMGDPKPLFGTGVGNLIYATRLASYRVSAGAFFQVNRHLTDELVNVVAGRDAHGTAGATGTALDLYAG